jgi:hypothetical protein
VEILHEIFGKEDAQGPIQSDSHLLFHSRELKQVDRPPEPPGDKSGKVDAENARNAGAPANGGKLLSDSNPFESLAALETWLETQQLLGSLRHVGS